MMKTPLETMTELCHCKDRPTYPCFSTYVDSLDDAEKGLLGFSAKPFEEQTIIEKLLICANIRRNAVGRKSVQEGQPDRLADLLEAAATEIAELEDRVSYLSTKLNGTWPEPIEDEIEIHLSRIIRGGSPLTEEQFDRLFDELNDQMILNQLGKYLRTVDTTNGRGYAIGSTDDLRAVVQQELYERLTGKS